MVPCKLASPCENIVKLYTSPTRFKFFTQGIQLLSFDSRISFHKPDSMDIVIKGSPFATAYFCKDFLPNDLIVEKLEKYEKGLLN